MQIAVCALVLTGIGMLLGFAPPVAFVAASGFVLTSTAVVMQLLAERGDVALPPGQKIVAILLFEDLLIVPLLAIVAWMAASCDPQAASQRWQGIGIGLACIVGLLVAGRWLLNRLFRILAASKAREVMTAAALLVVLGAALLMQVAGLSMAMGALLAGVLLSESTFRHQIEADIEPFRGILLGLFFLGVGMSLDLRVVAADWRLIVAGVLALMVGKGACIYAVARLMRSDHRQALDRGMLMAQGGEFACVLFAAASASGVIDAQVTASLTAIVVLSMALTPLFVLLQRRLTPAAAVSLDGVEEASGQTGSDLIIGFGRFGQVASQSLLARDVAVTIIDNDIEMMQSAEELGFKIYYGDGPGWTCCMPPARTAHARCGLRRQPGGGQSHRRTGNARVSACQAAGAFLRSPAFAATGGCGRGLPDPRDLRVGGDLRQSRAGGTGDGRGPSRHDFAPYSSARCRAFRIGDRCRRCTRRSRADVRQHVASRAPAHTVHATASRQPHAQSRCGAVSRASRDSDTRVRAANETTAQAPGRCGRRRWAFTTHPPRLVRAVCTYLTTARYLVAPEKPSQTPNAMFAG
ncbi:hypothetical protein LA22_11765, partial [Xanthomonas oryzae pv. oryzae]